MKLSISERKRAYRFILNERRVLIIWSFEMLVELLLALFEVPFKS